MEQAKADLDKWGAILIDEKELEYPGLAELKFDDDRTFEQTLTEAVNDIVNAINAPIDGMFINQKQWRSQKYKEVNDIVTKLQTELFGANGIDYAHKKAIKEFGKNLYKEAKAKVAHVIEENRQLKKKVIELESENLTLQGDYKLVKKRNTELNAKITQLNSESQNYKSSWEREKMARHADGSPVIWSGTKKQLTNAQYQKYLIE